MGQEFDEPSWRTWTSLFEPFELDWSAFDDDTFRHHQALIRLRNGWTALRQGSTEFIAGLPPGAIGYRRRGADQAVLVIVNLSRNPVGLPPESTGLTSLYARGLGLSAQGNAEIAPFGCVIAAQGLPA
jgi:glycosidase